MKEQADETSQEERAIHLFPLPVGWKWVTVGDAGAHQKNAIVDGPFGSNLKVSDYVEGGPVPVLTTKNLEGNYDNVRYISTAKFEELKRSAVYPGDILMAKIGSCGKTGIYPENKPPAMIPANLLKVTLNDQFELKYVYHYFNSTFFQKTLRTITKATAQPAFGVTNFRKLPLPYTARDQQKRIVAEIEKQFSRLDEAVANLKRVKANLKRYKAAVLKATVEGKLTEAWRKQHPDTEPASQLLQRILTERHAKWEQAELAKMQAKGKAPKDNAWKKKYPEPAAPDTTDLPELPEGWVWANLGQLAWSVKDGPHYSPKYQESGIPFISGGHIRPEGIDFSNTKFISPELHAELSERCKPEVGDLLYTKGGTTGIARVNAETRDFNVWVHVAVLKLVESLDRFYLQHALNSPYCYRQSQEYTHGVGNQDLGLTRMVKISIPLPSVTEQRSIVEAIERNLSLADEAEAQINANLQRADRLRQSILQRAFSCYADGNVPRD